MNRKFLNSAALAVLTGAFFLGGATNVLAAPSSRDIQAMKAEIEALKQQNEALSQRLEQMEQGMAGQNERLQAQETKLEEQKAKESAEEGSDLIGNIGKYISLHGSVDADIDFYRDFAHNNSSDINIDAVELEFEAKLSEWARAVALLKYEDGEDNIFLDEGYIVLGGTESFPAFFKLGKYVTPFGDYTTHMVDDPFTQTLGEINDGAATIGFSKNGFTGTVFAYNGVDEHDDEHEINGVGAALRYDREEEDGLNFSAGLGLVSNLATAGGIKDVLPRDADDKAVMTDTVAGLNVHGSIGYAGFSALAEYTTALDNFEAADLEYRGDGAQPAALNTELAYGTEIAGLDTEFALGFQKTWEALALEVPEFRYSAAVALGIFEGTTLTLEYFFDRDYDEADGGTGEDGHGFTTRLSYAF